MKAKLQSISFQSAMRHYASLRIEEESELIKFSIIQSGYAYGEAHLTKEQVKQMIGELSRMVND